MLVSMALVLEFVPAGEVALPRLVARLVAAFMLSLLLVPLLVPVWSLVPP